MLTGDVYRYSEARTKRDIATDRAAGVDSYTPGGGLPDGPTEVGQEERLNARLGGTVVSQVFVEENDNGGRGDELDDEQRAIPAAANRGLCNLYALDIEVDLGKIVAAGTIPATSTLLTVRLTVCIVSNY